MSEEQKVVLWDDAQAPPGQFSNVEIACSSNYGQLTVEPQGELIRVCLPCPPAGKSPQCIGEIAEFLEKEGYVKRT